MLRYISVVAFGLCLLPDAARNVRAASVPASPIVTVVPGEKLTGTLRHAELAIGADGSLHAAYNMPGENTQALAHVYVTSRDGGATWSEPVKVARGFRPWTDEDDDRIATDAAGRVYIFWRDHDPAFLPKAGKIANGLDLHCSVLEKGRWSPPFLVARPGDTHDYFVCADAAKSVHVVWCEFAHRAGSTGADLNLKGASAIFDQTVAGTTPGAPRPVITPAVKVVDEGYYGIRCDAYESINGYVDAQGLVHYVAAKVRSVAEAELNEGTNIGLVHFDGKQERPIIPLFYPQNRQVVKLASPASVGPDAKGRDHVIVPPIDSQVDPTVKDYTVDAGAVGAPIAIYSEDGKNPYVAAAQLVRGPAGRLAVLIESSAGGRDFTQIQDLRVFRFDGADWSAPGTPAKRDGQGKVKTKVTATALTQTESTFRTTWASGLFDASGGLDVLMTNQVHTAFGAQFLNPGAITGVGATASNSVVEFVKVAK